jgi:TRAP-type C4-dicarboxylate transport system permease large subunit
LSEVEDVFTESRKYVGIFNVVYGLLIGLIVLLVAGIILLYREVHGASRNLGGIFLGYGIINLIAVFIARGIADSQISQVEDIPASMQTWFIQLASSSLTPLFTLALVLLIAGAVMLTVPFIYKRSPNQTVIPE